VNIFYLDNDPIDCARMHNNKHTVKMILEYAQLLSTAHRTLDGVDNVLADPLHESMMYKATHKNHPSAVWCRKSKENYIWLCNLLDALCEEYTYRYEKTHKVQQSGLLYVLMKNVPKNIGTEGWSEPTPAMPDGVKVPGDSIASYRNYYNKNKTHLAAWKHREEPIWYGASYA